MKVRRDRPQVNAEELQEMFDVVTQSLQRLDISHVTDVLTDVRVGSLANTES